MHSVIPYLHSLPTDVYSSIALKRHFMEPEKARRDRRTVDVEELQ